MTIGGITLTTAAAPATPLEIAANQDADAIGTAFAAVSLASWKTALDAAGLTTAEANELVSVAYNSSTDKLSFAFSTAAAAQTIANPAAAITDPAVTGAAVLDATEGGTGFVPRAESADRFVFEATGAANGADIINNFDVSDTLDFKAYFNGAPVNFATVILDNSIAWSFGTLNWIVQGYNKGTLAASDFNGPGEMSIGNGAKNVFITTADADGVADATNQPYSVYYVYDSDATAGVSVAVQLVGTVNSAAELNVGTIIGVG